MRAQQEIFQEIARYLNESISDEWLEIFVEYWVEENHSKEAISYLVKKGGILVEISIPSFLELDSCMRELRDHLSINGKPGFSKCFLRFNENGEFNADYSYDAIIWENDIGWSFDTPHKESIM